jgi:5-methylcytosine-specific restriction endonuclease McrBC regulatory subunit McrC
MSSNPIIISANDCSPFENQQGHGEAIQHFISQKEAFNVFHIGDNAKQDELEIAHFNYKDALWYAGRLIGEATFDFEDETYKLIIKPRFGNVQLFRMLEEVFNVRLTDSKNTIQKNNEFQFLIKKLIAFLWLNLLSKANKHGIPRQNISKTYKGTTVRGRIDVRRTIIPLKTEKKIVSRYREKEADNEIATLLKKAYNILNAEYDLPQVKVTQNARNAIQQIVTTKTSNKYFTELDYHNIRYKEIYKSFKPVVDLSWDIVKKKSFGNVDDTKTSGMSFFLDMAEIWEIYLRSILKKRLAKNGWKLKNENIKTYKSKDFARTLIPDIVLEKDDSVMVWDAKYKRMKFKYFDYDRADFFQIHTYINYYQQNKNVIAGGLLYPLSEQFTQEKQDKNKASSLFAENATPTQFLVDGIDYSEFNESTITNIEDDFLDRIASIEINQSL